MSVELITQSAYARRRGVAKSAVAKAVSEGRISLINGKVDPAVADIQWAANTRARADSRNTPEPGHSSSVQTPASSSSPDSNPAGPALASDPRYQDARARREQAEMQQAEMKAAQMRGAMLMRADVDRAIFEIARDLRDSLSSCSRRIAAEVASVTSAEGCESVIDREHRILLEMLTLSCREKIGVAAPAGAHA